MPDNQQKEKWVTLADALPGFSLDQALTRLGGNIELYVRLLKKFAANHFSTAEELEDAIFGQDKKSAKNILHAVKGTSANLGASRLAQTSSELEEALASPKGTIESLSLFKACMKDTLHHIGKIDVSLESEQKELQKDIPYDGERVSKLLAELTVMLTTNDFQVTIKWRELKPLLSKSNPRTLKEFEHCIDRYDFCGAMSILAKIDKK